MLVKINKFLGKYKFPLLLITVLFLVLGFLFDPTFLILATITAGVPIFIKAIMALSQKAFSIELLVVIAIIGALYLQEYTESSLVSFFFLFGDYLESRTIEKTRSSIKMLLDLVPTQLTVLVNNQEVIKDVEDVIVGDLVLFKTGNKIGVDGVITSGSGSLNQASMTGESMPVYKTIGDTVLTGTILEQGTLVVEASQTGSDTSFAKMIELVEEAQETKTKTEKFLNRFAGWYTPTVIVLSILVYLVTKNLHMAITFLVIACPGALVIGAPVSTVAGIGNAAKKGVLFKGGESIEKMVTIDTILFDKTGTLTMGKPEVVVFEVFEKENRVNVYEKVYLAESNSQHPLAKSIQEYLSDKVSVSSHHLESEVVIGQGVKALIDDELVLVGNEKLLIEHNIQLDDSIQNKILSYQKQGMTVTMIGVQDEVVGLIGIKDQIKPDSKKMIDLLRQHKIKNVMMLSGDHQETVDFVAKELGLDRAYGNLSPADKADVIKSLQQEGFKVMMVGDGINDAAGIAVADLGMAIGLGGSDVAIESADVILMSDQLSQIVKAKDVAHRTVNNINQNVAIAMGTVAILLVGVLFEKVGLSIGMFVHEASVLGVVLNALRLLR